MQKFEYHVEVLRNKMFKITPKGDCPELMQRLNTLGQEGWELTGVTTSIVLAETRATTAFFKRPLA